MDFHIRPAVARNQPQALLLGGMMTAVLFWVLGIITGIGISGNRLCLAGIGKMSGSTGAMEWRPLYQADARDDAPAGRLGSYVRYQPAVLGPAGLTGWASGKAAMLSAGIEVRRRSKQVRAEGWECCHTENSVYRNRASGGPATLAVAGQSSNRRASGWSRRLASG